MSDGFTFSSEDPAVQAALEARRIRVLTASGRLPTWSEDAQYVGGFNDGRAAVLAEQGEPEWGVEYDVSSTETIFTAAHSEAMARKWVEESPTDTGLRWRRPAGPWLPVEDPS